MTDEASPPPKPTLMRQYEDDEDLDNWVIQHAYMFTVIEVRPGGFVRGEGSNYGREEIHVAKYGSTEVALQAALDRAAEIFLANRKRILIYAVADFAGAIGFNRPVRQYPPSTFKSKADKRRDEQKAKTARKAQRDLSRELARKDPKKIKEPKAAVFKTSFEPSPGPTAQMLEDDFMASPIPMVRIVSF